MVISIFLAIKFGQRSLEKLLRFLKIQANDTAAVLAFLFSVTLLSSALAHMIGLHVAFGAATKVAHGKTFKYLYNSERYETFVNLWGQYADWRRKQDWIAGKNAEGYAKIASESQIPF